MSIVLLQPCNVLAAIHRIHCINESIIFNYLRKKRSGDAGEHSRATRALDWEGEGSAFTTAKLVTGTLHREQHQVEQELQPAASSTWESAPVAAAPSSKSSGNRK